MNRHLPGLLAVVCLLAATPLITAAEGTRGTIVDDAANIQPLLPGMQVPFLTGEEGLQLPAHGPLAEEDQVGWQDLITGGPTVLIFYRGGWCPYCTKHLAAIGNIHDQLTAQGWRVVGVTPDRIEKLQESGEDVPYTLVSDSGLALSKAFGLAFRLDEKTLEKYDGYGIDLQDATGEDHNALPVPAVFLVDPEGTIHFSYVNPDYSVRLQPSVLSAAAAAYLPP